MKFPHLLVVSASAGAGKTQKLSQRYLKFVLSLNIPPESILTLTFTNKATQEMKRRIIRELKEKALFSPFLSEQKKAEKILNQLLKKYADFRVQTIDSFFTSVIKASAVEFDLPPDFEISLSLKNAFTSALENLLAEITPSSQRPEVKTAFLELLKNFYLIEGEKIFPLKKNILERMVKLEEIKFSRGKEIKKLFSFSFRQEKYKEFFSTLTKFLSLTEGRLKKRYFCSLKEILSTTPSRPWQRSVFLHSFEEIKQGKVKMDEGDRKKWEEVRNRLPLLVEIFCHQLYSPFIGFLSLLEEELKKVREEKKIVFIEDLAFLLDNFLERESAVPEVYFYLGEKIFHFFLDEFQDTNRQQWESLFPLIEEALSRGGSLFYVGDKKQAIYGFRGGETQLFDEAKESFLSLEKNNIQEKYLKSNYRSGKNIVEFINQTFSAANLKKWIKTSLPSANFSWQLIFENYQNSQQEFCPEKEEGLVRIEKVSFPSSFKKEEEKRIIEEKLVILLKEDLLCRFPAQKIAILTRTNKEAAEITETLAQEKIPVASEKTLNLVSHSLIQEIISFLSFLNFPPDNFSFAHFISGQIFKELSGLKKEEIHSFLLSAAGQEKVFYPLFRERYPFLWREYIEEFFHAVGFLPPYDLVSQILKKYQLLERFSKEEAFFYQLLEALKEEERKGKNNLEEFLAIFQNEEEFPESFLIKLPEIAAVQVLTVHKAKGLEFPVVIYPFAYLRKPQLNFIYQEDEKFLTPYYVRVDDLKQSPLLNKIYSERFQEQVLDELNIFYVALSRAREELYLFLFSATSSQHELPPPIFLDTSVWVKGQPVAQKPSPVSPQKKKISFSTFSPWSAKIVRKEKKLSRSLLGEQRRGELMHRFLAKIDRLSANWQEDLEEKITPFLPPEEKEIMPFVKQLLAHPEINKWFILPPEIRVYQEKEIVSKEGERLKMDRLLIFPERVVLIEFKSGKFYQQEDAEQVRLYLSCLKEMFPSLKVEGRLVYFGWPEPKISSYYFSG